MSYDLSFVPKDAGQSWDQALDVAEDRASPRRPDPAVWEALLAGSRRILGELEVFTTEGYYELSHDPSGIQINYFGGCAGITVPYWYTGAEAEAVLAVIYELGAMIEEVTGFSGYDPQVQAAIAEAASTTDRSVATFDTIAAFLADTESGQDS